MDKSTVIARSLMVIGAIFLVAAGVAAYPYLHSRLAALPPTPATAAPSEVSTPTSERADGAQGNSATLPDREPLASLSPVTVPTAVPRVGEEAAGRTPEVPITAPPTRIVIPSLGIDGPVIAVAEQRIEVGGQLQVSWEVPNEYAAGWHEKSALMGERGNMVLNGHNTSYGEIFRDLYTLEIGDEIIVHSEELSRTYIVSETLILPEAGQPMEVRLANARYVMPTDDDRLTLVTCHPYGSLRNRLIVIATPFKSGPSVVPQEAQ